MGPLARESAEFYLHPPEGFSSQPLLRKVGLSLAARAEETPSLASWRGGDPVSVDVRDADLRELYRRVALLGSGLGAAVYEANEGVIDVHGLLQGYLRGSSGEVRLGCEATPLRVAGGRVTGLETSCGLIEAGKVVIATGGWGVALADQAGLPLPFTPYRRHLLLTEPLPQVDPDWPAVWIVGDEFYFRPDSGGLLMCGCDAVTVDPGAGEVTDPAQLERIASKAARWLPSLAHARVARAWAGVCTFAPDHRFVIGRDPRVGSLFWVAGLGGHGIT